MALAYSKTLTKPSRISVSLPIDNLPFLILPSSLFLSPMPDRADYLARTLIARMRSLETVLAEDADAGGARRRIELVEKVLAIEAGVLDGALHRITLAAMPAVTPDKAVSDRELREFSAFLRARLPADA
jgi:hypothetical protein